MDEGAASRPNPDRQYRPKWQAGNQLACRPGTGPSGPRGWHGVEPVPRVV